MPIYEYECPTCGRFELIEKAGKKALKNCPTCKENGKDVKIERTVSAPAFHLKGSGWYKTDYAASGSASAKSPKGKGKESSSASSEDAAGGESSPSTKGSSDDSSGAAPAKAGCGTTCGCH